MGGFILKNWKPRRVISFLKKSGFIEIKKKNRGTGDHCCLYKGTGINKKYTEIDKGKKTFSAREMHTFAKQTGIEKKLWLKRKYNI